ncbi:monocarboxylate transporter 13-like isoform X2 [Ornithodoros turicata]
MDSKNTAWQQHGPDSLHSWLTAAACALSTFFAVGGMRSSGFLYVAIVDRFGVSRAEASWPIVLMGGVLLLSGLLSGPLAHRFTARPVVIVGGIISASGMLLCYFATSATHLTVTLGIMHGLGSGMVFVMNTTFINEHFVKYKGLAMGINFAGSTMGTFVFPKLLEYLTRKYGLNSALLIFSAITLHSVAFSLFLRQPTWLKKKEVANSRNFLYGLTVFKSGMFYVVMYSYIAFNLCFDTYISLLVDFAKDKGLSTSSAVTVLSLSSVADLAGRLTLPAVADRGVISRSTLLVCSFMVMSGLYVAMPLTDSFVSVLAVATSMAFVIGTSVVLFSVLLAEYLGLDRVAMAYGMVTASAGILSFGKPFVIGYFRDQTGSYDPLFRGCGIVVLSAVLVWTVALLRNKIKSHTWTVDEIKSKAPITISIISTKCDAQK